MQKYKQIAKDLARRYLDYPNLMGIIWIGSSSFGIVDEHSDIDIRLVVSTSEKQRPMQKFVVDGVEIEVDEMSYSWLVKDVNPVSEQRWITEKCVLLYDPEKNLSRRLSRIKSDLENTKKQALWQSYKSLFLSYEVEKSLSRDDRITARLFVFKAIENLFEFIHLYKNEPVPPFKWRYYFIKENNMLSAPMLTKIVNVIDKNQKSDLDLSFLQYMETYSKKLMLNRGYSESMVNSPWRY